jgi:polyferredoxin
MIGEEPRGRNLLHFRPVAAIARSRFYPAALQWASAAFFAVIVWQLMLGPESAHDNFGTALTWVLWWPLIPLLFVLVGRFWCAVCPFGWLQDQVQKLVAVNRPVPAFLKRYGIWIIDASFIFITWADHVWGIVESPWGSGLLLLTMTTAVVGTAAFFQRRAFCRYLCFLGGIAGNYSRTGMVALRADAEVCKTCTSRAACFNGTATSAPCPVFEFPRTMDSNANCNLCASCIKSCPHGAISLTVRPPTRELWFIRRPKLSESMLAMAIMGIVLVQNVTMLGFWEDILAWLEQTTGTTSYAVNYTIAFTVAISLPILLLLLASRGAAFLGHGSTGQLFTSFGYALIPLDIAAHIAHNLFHLLAEGKSIFVTGLALFGRESGEGSAAVAGANTIQALQYTILALGVAGSVYTAYRIAAARSDRLPRLTGRLLLAPYASLILVLAGLNVWLFALPMAHRM